MPTRMALAAAAIAALVGLSGCGGGGGGGGGTAEIRGKILLVTTGAAPDPAATVTVAGASATTAVDGSFVIRANPTAAQISVTAVGFKPLTQPLPALSATTINDLGSVYLSDVGYTANVIGRAVRADTAEPITGARVRISGQTLVTLADGKFAFTGLPVGLGGTTAPVGAITVTGLEEKPIIMDLPLGASPPVNDLGDVPVSPPVGGIPGGPSNIGGQITLQGRTDYSGTTVTLTKRFVGTVIAIRTTGADGKYALWAPSGEYVVTAEHAGYVTGSGFASLPASNVVVTVNLNLVP